ncbi:sterol desaturase family protein [Paenibacillus elgii]
MLLVFGWLFYIRNPRKQAILNYGAFGYGLWVGGMACFALDLAMMLGGIWWLTALGGLIFVLSDLLISFLLYYEWTHYVAHRPIKPITPWGRWMKKVHLWHHYKSKNYWYGVTNPLFDVMLGTFRDEQQVEKSETARNLEGKADARL